MKAVPARLFISISIVLCISCGGDDGPTGPGPDPGEENGDGNLVSREIGTDGGEITTDDENLTLVFPEGALSGTETITIGKLSEEDLGTEFDELIDSLGISSAYVLGPDGLQFDQPVTVTITSDQTVQQEDGSLQVALRRLVAVSSDGELEALENLRLEPTGGSSDTTETNNMQLSGELSHFSDLGVTETDDTGLLTASFSGVPDAAEFGQEVTVDVRADVSVSVVGATFVPQNSGLNFVPTAGFDDVPMQEVEPESPVKNYELSPTFICKEELGSLADFLALIRTQSSEDQGILGEAGELQVALPGQMLSCVDDATYTLIAQKEGNGSGTVTGISYNSGTEFINCPENCRQDSVSIDFDGGFDGGLRTMQLEAIPSENSVFAGWSGETGGGEGCEESPPEGGTCVVEVDRDRTVTATFSSSSETGGINIQEFNVVKSEEPGQVSLDATVNYQFADRLVYHIDWGDGNTDEPEGTQPGDDPDVREVNDTHTYTTRGEKEVTFSASDSEANESAEEGFDLSFEDITGTIQKEGGGDGTVTGTATDTAGLSWEQVNCGDNCSYKIDSFNYSYEDSDLELTAKPDDNSIFDGWGGDLEGSDGCGTLSTCRVPLTPGNRTITATFLPIYGPPEITAFTAESIDLTEVEFGLEVNFPGPPDILGGTIDFGDGTTGSVDDFEQENEDNYTAIMTHEYGSVGNYTSEATVTNEKSGEQNKSTIEIESVTLTVNKQGNGDGTVIGEGATFLSATDVVNCAPGCTSDSGDVLYIPQSNTGVSIPIYAEPEEGSVFTGWSGESCDGTGDCTVTMDQNRTVTATFEPVPAPEITSISVDVPFTSSPNEVEFEVEGTFSGDVGALSGVVEPGTGDAPVSLSNFEKTGDTFSATAELTYMQPGIFTPNVIIETGGGSDSQQTGTLYVEQLSITRDGNGEGQVTGFDDDNLFVTEIFTCDPECTINLVRSQDEGIGAINVRLEPEPAEGSAFDGWGGDLSGGQGCGGTGNCLIAMDQNRSITATFKPLSSGDGELVTGETIGIPANMGALEGFASFFQAVTSAPKTAGGYSTIQQVEEKQFGKLSGQLPVGFSGDNGYAIVDILTGEVLLSDDSGFAIGSPAFGVIGLTETPPGPDSPATIILYGESGIGYYDTDGGGTNAAFQPTAFDAYPAGGNPESGYAVSVQSGIQYISFNSSVDFHNSIEFEKSGSAFAGQLVSAWMPNGSDPTIIPALAVDRDTDPNTDQESGLYVVPRNDDPPIRAADVGLDARKIRCAPNGLGTYVCGVTIFGDDQLAIFTWDGTTSEPTKVETVSIGDGPVNLDIRLLDSGNIGVATTGFNDNTITVTELDTDGNMLNNNTQAVPSGCQSPGHALFIEDAASLKVMATCSESGNYFLLESNL